MNLASEVETKMISPALCITLALVTIVAANPLMRVARDGVVDIQVETPPPSTCSAKQTKIGNLTNYANVYHDVEDSKLHSSQFVHNIMLVYSYSDAAIKLHRLEELYKSQWPVSHQP